MANAGTWTMVEIRCASCGTMFGVSNGLNDLRNADGGLFYCPNGHGQLYGRSVAKRKEEAEASAAAWEAEAQRLLEVCDGLRDQVAALKRAAAGGPGVSWWKRVARSGR